MNADIHLEHRADSSQGKHEGEPSLGLCDRLNRTRDNSQRQLPTDHDYAVSTREYQTDQSSLKTAPTAARSVFGKGKQRQRQPHCCAVLTRSLHIRPMATRRKKTFNGMALCVLGAGTGAEDGAGMDVPGCAALAAAPGVVAILSADFSGVGGFLTGTTVVCFLCIWPRVTAQAGGL